MAVVFYITGHGFGHAVRQIAIVNALAQRRPEVPIVVRTSVAAWLFGRSVRASVRLEPGPVDTGAIQRGSLDVDVPATLAAAQAFYAEGDAWVAREAAFLADAGARLVVADIPPLPIAAARQAGVPAIGISNFTWDWIYEDYEARRLAPGLVETLQAHYASAGEGWRLPMHGGFGSFSTLRDLPLVARVARQPRDMVRAALGLPPERPLVLVSLGGYGARGIDLHAAAASLRGVADVVSTSYDAFTPGDGVHRIDEPSMYGQRIRYEDLLAAVDIVASKPGYGIISECAANGTALLYTDRGRFCEYDVLVREMPRYLEAAFIGQPDLVAGRWRDAVVELLAKPPRPPAAAEGAAMAADWLSAWLDRG
ncbi:MAG TPA: hypothetical protein VNR90_12325 [Vicinamibacterales bacterium]|nr:hypothetical protein [Vicinamibacterales bacterium]